MPNAETFSVPPIAGFVQKYLLRSKVSMDPFARNKRWATYTNDLNPDTKAEMNMDAVEYLEMMAAIGNRCDAVLIDQSARWDGDRFAWWQRRGRGNVPGGRQGA